MEVNPERVPGVRPVAMVASAVVTGGCFLNRMYHDGAGGQAARTQNKPGFRRIHIERIRQNNTPELPDFGSPKPPHQLVLLPG